MNKSIRQKFKRNIIVLSIIITMVFLVINISLYIINNSYLLKKIEDENEAFLQLTTHLINENDLSIAIEYIEHYTHIHEVDIELLDGDDNMLFSSNVAHLYSSRHVIETLQGRFTIFIDNTDSITVNTLETNTVYVNIALISIYIIAIIILLRINNSNSKQIDLDIRNVIKLIEGNNKNHLEFNHEEFEHIYSVITKYIENIDLLTEQKEMNMKGLAHDIKTPLTVVYSYFERIMKNEIISEKDTMTSFEQAKRINELLNDIIENNKRNNNKSINLSQLLLDKTNEYTSIFKTKNINFDTKIEDGIVLHWSEKDLIRVFDNIISNAYYYSIDNSLFIIKASIDKKIVIEFTSTPSNIDDFHETNIFTKGHRGSLSIETNKYGKGFGLYLCRLLLDDLGGSILAEKENENVKITVIL